MFLANREHKDTLARMEQKFFEEKVSYSHSGHTTAAYYATIVGEIYKR